MAVLCVSPLNVKNSCILSLGVAYSPPLSTTPGASSFSGFRANQTAIFLSPPFCSPEDVRLRLRLAIFSFVHPASSSSSSILVLHTIPPCASCWCSSPSSGVTNCSPTPSRTHSRIRLILNPSTSIPPPTQLLALFMLWDVPRYRLFAHSSPVDSTASIRPSLVLSPG